MVKKLKIATIGGGSSYTPELIEGFIQRKDELPIGEIWLVDIEEGREKLEVVGGLIKRMVAAAGLDWQVHLTLDRRAALKDADFVTTQFRVGLLDARVKDERIPLSHGILGQETNGAGGIFKAFRTIPVILDIVEDIKELCPNAWVINFTNPAGMVTEAVLKYGQFERIVGLCNVPLVHTMTEAKAIGRDPEDVVFLYGGLNHFHWHRVYDRDGKEITEQVMDVLFADGGKDMENIRRLDFQAEQIRDLGVLPCGYHRYYYLAHDMLQAALEDYEKNETRAEVVKRIEAELLDLYRDPDLDVKPDRLAKRGGAYYSDAACEAISAIYNDKRSVMVVNTLNRGALPDLPADVVVEVSSVMTSAGPQPIAFGKLNPALRGSLQLMKAMEEVTIEAAITGDYGKALQAFTLNPLIPGGTIAKTLLDEMLVAHEEHLPQFAEVIEQIKRR
ncbi:MAG: 6-phospho-beta-glucosidase [Bacillota bacterium]|nr:6-phospho-beta-glucosidase [Bacillota bacterium]